MSRRSGNNNQPQLSEDDISDVSDVDSNISDSNSEGEGDDLTDALMMRQDQRRDTRLDYYDATMLGDSTDDEGDYGLHQQVTRKLDEQDEQVKKLRKRGAFLLGGPGEDGDPLLHSQDDLHYLVEPTGDDLPLHELDIPPDQLLAQPRAPETIKKRFLSLLLDYEVDGVPVYEEAINSMAEENKASFQVDFTHLIEQEPVIAELLLKAPKEMLSLLEDEGNRLINLRYPNYVLIHETCNVRFVNVGHHTKLVDIRHDHMNRFISLHGVVVRRSNVYPKLQSAVYQCVRCNTFLPPVQQSLIGVSQLPHIRCPQSDCQSRSIRLNQTQSMFQNFQKITIQESPGAVQAGRIPRQVEVVVFDDLIDACLPGEEVEIIGYLQLVPDTHMNRQTGFPIYNTTVVANNVLKKKSKSFSTNDTITEHDIRLIEDLASSPNIQHLIISSIAPSIYGHYDIKTAIACSLFAGCAKELESKARLRGDINVLLVGDPGVAKSQFLKYTEKIGHRAVYTTGKGASAVGLTATVQRDKFTGEWTLEGGALVLADQGTCLIDEFDKMSDQDRTSIHEAMEQQTISISKAGIVCTLKARCGVIAAANPIGGNYDNSLTFQEQVDLTEPILSRFDILCVVRDKIDRENDERLARFVTAAHTPANTLSTSNTMSDDDELLHTKQSNNNDNNEDDVTIDQMRERGYLTQKLLAKYILHTRSVCQPSLKNINNDKIISLYKQLRRAASRSGGIQITPRHLESLLRISEALAKMRLAHYVNDDDVNTAIHIMLDSFFQSQKLSVRQEFERQFSQYVFQVYDKHNLILDVIKSLMQETISHRQVLGATYEQAIKKPVIVKTTQIYTRCSNAYGNIDLNSFFNSDVFNRTPGMVYDATTGTVSYTFEQF